MEKRTRPRTAGLFPGAVPAPFRFHRGRHRPYGIIEKLDGGDWSVDVEQVGLRWSGASPASRGTAS